MNFFLSSFSRDKLHTGREGTKCHVVRGYLIQLERNIFCHCLDPMNKCQTWVKFRSCKFAKKFMDVNLVCIFRKPLWSLSEISAY